ncbi:MAG: OsmC family protein [Acholeplasmataceae bacterium]
MSRKVLYESVVTNKQADHGFVTSSKGKSLEIKPTLSKELGHNPGELLAFSWATCLESTLRYVCEKRNIITTSYTSVRFVMHIDQGPPRGYKFFYEATLFMAIEGEQLRQSLLEETHLRCPISKLLKPESVTLKTEKIKSTS